MKNTKSPAFRDLKVGKFENMVQFDTLIKGGSVGWQEPTHVFFRPNGVYKLPKSIKKVKMLWRRNECSVKRPCDFSARDGWYAYIIIMFLLLLSPPTTHTNSICCIQKLAHAMINGSIFRFDYSQSRTWSKFIERMLLRFGDAPREWEFTPKYTLAGCTLHTPMTLFM